MRRCVWLFFLALSALGFTDFEAQAAVFDVKTYGAMGDGNTLDTGAINKAIEAANAAGGGTVYFPSGTYLSGSIHLKSSITLYLDPGGNHQGFILNSARLLPGERASNRNRMNR